MLYLVSQAPSSGLWLKGSVRRQACLGWIPARPCTVMRQWAECLTSVRSSSFMCKGKGLSGHPSSRAFARNGQHATSSVSPRPAPKHVCYALLPLPRMEQCNDPPWPGQGHTAAVALPALYSRPLCPQDRTTVTRCVQRAWPQPVVGSGQASEQSTPSRTPALPCGL